MILWRTLSLALAGRMSPHSVRTCLLVQHPCKCTAWTVGVRRQPWLLLLPSSILCMKGVLDDLDIWMKFELMLWYCIFWFLYMWWLVCVCVYYAMQYVIFMHCCFLVSYPLSVLWLPGKGSGVLDLVSAHFSAKLSLKNDCCGNGVHIEFCFHTGDFLLGVTSHIGSVTMRGCDFRRQGVT